MEDGYNEMIHLKTELEKVRKENRELSLDNERLANSAEFNRRYNEQSAKLLAIEYIIKSSNYSIEKGALCSILGIELVEEE